MAKDQTVVFGSPFKFGFFAGMGFFFASLLMSGLGLLLVVLLGLGTIGAIIGGSRAAQDHPTTEARPARVQTSDVR
jgi:hypothetical protein